MAPKALRIGEAMPRHEVQRVSISSQSISLPRWAGWLAYGILASLILQLVAIFLPLTWNWEWRNLGSGSQTWSMCAPGGVMPLSQYWITKSPEYKVGDIVSFQYKNGGTVENNGASIKMVDMVEPGRVHVRGLNKRNSMPPCWVSLPDINGKIVAGPISLMPTAYWRWITLDWTLSRDRARDRQDHLKSKLLRSVWNKRERQILFLKLAHWEDIQLGADRWLRPAGRSLLIYSVDGMKSIGPFATVPEVIGNDDYGIDIRTTSGNDSMRMRFDYSENTLHTVGHDRMSSKTMAIMHNGERAWITSRSSIQAATENAASKWFSGTIPGAYWKIAFSHPQESRIQIKTGALGALRVEALVEGKWTQQSCKQEPSPDIPNGYLATYHCLSTSGWRVQFDLPGDRQIWVKL